LTCEASFANRRYRLAQSKQENVFGDSCLKLPMMVCLTVGNAGADDFDDDDVEKARNDDVSRKEVGDAPATEEDDDAPGMIFGLS